MAPTIDWISVKNLARKYSTDFRYTITIRFHNAHSSGTTQTYNTKIFINEEVMKCDFKIAIGMVVPHPASGFGGGGKIIMPGVASFDTIEHNHRMTVADEENKVKIRSLVWVFMIIILCA